MSIWSALLTIASTLLGIVLTHIFHLVRYNYEQKDRKLMMRLEKIEELYLLFADWQKSCKGFYLSLFKYSDINEDVSRLNKILEDHEKDQTANALKNNTIKIEMLLNLYLMELIKDYQLVIEKRSLVSKYINNLPKNKKENTQLVNCIEQFDSQCEQFKNEISETTNRLLN